MWEIVGGLAGDAGGLGGRTASDWLSSDNSHDMVPHHPLTCILSPRPPTCILSHKGSRILPSRPYGRMVRGNCFSKSEISRVCHKSFTSCL